MKKINILLAILVLVLASLACQTVMGGEGEDFEIPDLPQITDVPQVPQSNENDSQVPPTVPPVPGGDGITIGGQTEFPGKLGYAERDLLTVTSDTTFSMVFDGHESGKAISVQGVDLGDGTVNISIALVDL